MLALAWTSKMSYKKKTDKELAKEFVRVYHKEPTPNELKQYRDYLDSFSVDAWIENQSDGERRKEI